MTIRTNVMQKFNASVTFITTDNTLQLCIAMHLYINNSLQF